MLNQVRQSKRILAYIASSFLLAGIALGLVWLMQANTPTAEYYGERGSLLFGPSDVAYRQSNFPLATGSYLVTDADASSLIEVGSNGRVRAHSNAEGEMKAPSSVAVLGDSFYVADVVARKVFEYDTNNTLHRVFDFGEAQPFALEASGEQILVGTNYGIAVLDTRSGSQGNFKLSAISTETSAALIKDIARSDDGRIFVLMDDFLVRYDSLEATTAIQKRVSNLSGLALSPDGQELYASDSRAGTIRSFSLELEELESNPAFSGLTLDAPQGLNRSGDELLIADRFNSRFIRADLDKNFADILASYLWVVPLLMFACSALAFLLRAFIKAPALSFDLRASEGFITRAGGLSFAEHFRFVRSPEIIAEQAHRSFFDIEIRSERSNEKVLSKLAESYAELDRIDLASLELALKNPHEVFVAQGDALRQAALSAGVNALSLDEFLQNFEETSTKPQLPRPTSSQLNLPLVLLALVLGSTLTFMLTEPLHADDEVARLKVDLAVPSLEASASADKVHSAVLKDCTLCHVKEVPRLLFERTRSHRSACERCHLPASGRSHTAAYFNQLGSARDFNKKDSGHQIGLAQLVPNSSNSEGLFELNCFSCHSVLEQKENASCESCHDTAVRASDGSKVTSFELAELSRAHQKSAGLFEQGHEAKAGECYSCHRGGLERGSECTVCHYNSFDFEVDAKRAKNLADWPHASSGDRALLGNWEVKIDLDSEKQVSTQYLTQPATLNKREAEPSAKSLELSSYCSRCHFTIDDKKFALSIHDLVHDPVTASPDLRLTAPNVESIVTTTSQGYIKTGKYQTQGLSLLIPETGDMVGSYSDVECTNCHLTNVAAEHMLRSEKSCSICHENLNQDASYKDVRYESDIRDFVKAESFATCGTLEDGCHAQDWHGFDKDRVQKAHTIPEGRKSRSCSGPAGDNATCHSMASTESLFHFGDMDLASAHNDYWSAQNETHVTNSLYDATTSKLDDVRGCTLCHNAESISSGTQKVSSCADCHNISNKPYALGSCYRAELVSLESSETSQAIDANQIAALEYLQDLKARQEEARKQVAKNRSKNEPTQVGQKQKPEIPRYLRPLTDSVPLNSELSVIGRMLSGKPSIINDNRFVGKPLQVR